MPDARLACVNGTSGWFTAAGTVILGRDWEIGATAGRVAHRASPPGAVCLAGGVGP